MAELVQRSKQGRQIKRLVPRGAFLIGCTLLSVLAISSSAHASSYDWGVKCFSAPEQCWATDLEPDSGPLGNAARDDDVNSLPTLDSNGLSYGDASLNPSTDSPLPSTGGDYPWGGGDSVSEQQCTEHPYPEGVACNWSASQFASQNYTDSSGAWHFAMGGAGQCESNGDEVPCNLGVRLYPYDCLGSYSTLCTFTTPLDDPFDWDFPEDMEFHMGSKLYVGGDTGAWHAFLCADLSDSNTGDILEICDEPWNSTGYYEYPHFICNGDSITYWQGADEKTPYMTSLGEKTSAVASWIQESWNMTRAQLFNLLTTAHEQCGISTDEYSADNYKLLYTEDGIEEIGAGGYGADIDWETTEEEVVTNY